MSFLNKLAGLPASLKESWKKTFGDVDVVLDDAVDDAASDGVHAPPRARLSLERASEIIGVSSGAALDEVRAAVRGRARALHPRVVARDPTAAAAMDELVAASELLEEHLLPALRGSAPAASSTTAPTATAPAAAASAPRAGRQRATPRSTQSAT
jgi:hypothetical protein